MFEYGSRVGFWRIMRLFAERDLSMTIYACALALERNLPAAEASKASGHDIRCHGWRWVKHFKLSAETEREHIRLAMESLRRTVGTRPLGWYCRYGPSVNTRRLVMLPLTAVEMEHHVHASQAFLPLDCAAYLVLVAPHGADGLPDPDGLRAFPVPMNTGLNYRADTCHHPLTALERTARFAVLTFVDGTAGDEQFVPLGTPVAITAP